VNDRSVLEVVDAFYRAFLAGDRDALAEVVAPKAAWIVPLDTVVSGAHIGPDGIVALRRTLDELTSRTWRPLRDDSVDIGTSEWHGVIMDRFQAERGERRLDSHEAVVVAVEKGRIVRIFHYLHSPEEFAIFWSR
jgi:ketosteroid isomerase-like protein